jgi:hypothetical protein
MSLPMTIWTLHFFSRIHFLKILYPPEHFLGFGALTLCSSLGKFLFPVSEGERKKPKLAENQDKHIPCFREGEKGPSQTLLPTPLILKSLARVGPQITCERTFFLPSTRVLEALGGGLGASPDLEEIHTLALCKFCLADRQTTEVTVSTYFRAGH